MNGGLLQLATVGKEDTPLTKKPELNPFLANFKKYTNFSLDQNEKNLGAKNFNSNFQTNIGNSGDLLRDIFFYVEIPYFEITKKVSNKKIIQNTDTKLYNLENDLGLTFIIIKNNKIYLVPEYIITQKTQQTNFNLFEISNQNKFYQDFLNNYNKNSTLFTPKENNINPILPFLKINSIWFSKLIDDNIDNFNQVLLDLKKFKLWLNNEINHDLFLSFHQKNNLSNFYNLCQINHNNTNEVKKYFELSNKNFEFDFFNDEKLDVDYAMNYAKNNENIETYVYNTLVDNSNFLYFILKNLFDSSGNTFYFYKTYFANTQSDNSIIDEGTEFYQIKNYKSYLNHYYETSFLEQNKKKYKLPLWEIFNDKASTLEKEIETIWSQLNLRNNDNNQYQVDFIFSIIYTFVTRYQNFTNFDTINFLDLFTKKGEKGFFESLKENFNNYQSLEFSKNVSGSVFNLYANNLDFNLLYNYIVYSLVKNIDLQNYFENYNSITKQNIQFLYWTRNKIANQIFLRYKRNLDKQNYPNFKSITQNEEVIDFYHIFDINSIISLDEIKYDIISSFNSYSYLGIKTDDNNVNFSGITKVGQITSQNIDSTNISKLKYKFYQKINKYEQIENKIIIKELLDFIPNVNTKIYIENNKRIYPVNKFYIDFNEFILYLDKITIKGDIKLLVIDTISINNYYIDYNPISISKENFEFDINHPRKFRYDYFIETNLLDFKIIQNTKPIERNISIANKNLNDNNIFEYKLLLKENENIYLDLTNENSNNYTHNLNQRIIYQNPDQDNINFKIKEIIFNNETILIIETTNENYLELNKDSIYRIYINDKSYVVELKDIDLSKSFKIINLSSNYDFDSISPTNYYLEENISRITIDNFSLNGELFNVEIKFDGKYYLDLDNAIKLDINKPHIIIVDNFIYYIELSVRSSANSQYYISNNRLPDLDVNETYNIYADYHFLLNNSIDLNLENTFYLSFFTNSTEKTFDCNLKPYYTNGSNFTNNKFEYLFIFNNKNINDLIFNEERNFTIKGYYKNSENINLYQKSNDKISINHINENIIKHLTFDFDNFYYLLKIKDNDNSYKKLITTNQTINNNQIKLIKQNDFYYLDLTLSKYNNISLIDLQIIKKISNKFTVKGNILKDENENKIIEFIKDDYEIIFNKYIDVSNTYKLIYNNEKYQLSIPSISDKISFKLLSSNNIDLQSNINLTFENINNKLLPNLIEYTSFHLLENAKKSYDLMDYFIQTPMIIYQDNNEKKNSEIILMNLPVNFNKVELDYIYLDNQDLNLINKINSNQLLRYDNNLISSCLDDNIYDENNVDKKQLLIFIENKWKEILSKYNINEIINTIEETNNKTINLYNDLLDNISTYGKTINQLVNIINKNNKLDQWNSFDFDLYSKKVIDFYGNKDLNIIPTSSVGSGKDIFQTNYLTFDLSKKISDSNLEFLKEYSIQIIKQINYINDNINWFSLSGYNLSNQFEYFTKYQSDYYNYLVENTEFEYKTQINYLSEPVDSTKEINKNDHYYSSNYIDNQINNTNNINKWIYLGPVIIENKQLKKDYLELDDLDENKNWGIIIQNDYYKLTNKTIDNPINCISDNFTIFEYDKFIPDKTFSKLYYFKLLTNNILTDYDFILVDNHIIKIEEINEKTIYVLALINLSFNYKKILIGKTNGDKNNIFEKQKFNLINWEITDITIDKIEFVKEFNHYIDNYNNEKVFCFNEGNKEILYLLNRNYIYFNVEKELELYYIINSTKYNKPIKVENKKLVYYTPEINISSDNYIYYDDKITKFDSLPNINVPTKMRLFNGNIFNFTQQISAKIDLVNNKLDLLDKSIQGFFYYENKFYNTKDFTPENLTSNLITIHWLDNLFDQDNEIFTYKEEISNNINFNPSIIKFNDNQNLLYLHPDYNYPLNNKYQYNLENTFIIFQDDTLYYQPIHFNLVDNKEILNYRLYQDKDLTQEISSNWIIPVANKEETNSIYLNFLKESDIIRAIKSYEFDESLINNIDIISYDKNINLETLAMDLYKISILDGSIYESNKFYTFVLNVKLDYNSKKFDFDVIFNLFYGNYPYKLQMKYSNLDIKLREPIYITQSFNDNIEFVVKKNDIILPINYVFRNIFKENESNWYQVNLSREVNSIIKSYYIDIELNNNKIGYFNSRIEPNFYWEYLDEIKINKNIIYLPENSSDFYQQFNHFILYTNELIHVNIIEKQKDRFIIDRIINSEKAIIFVLPNYSNWVDDDINFISIKNKLYINVELGRLIPGQIIKVQKNILLITNYNLEFNKYEFKRLNNFYISNQFYSGYFDLGRINNIYEKNNLVNYSPKNYLINKKIKDMDFKLESYNENQLNYGFTEKEKIIKLTKIDDTFYYDGPKIPENSYLYKNDIKFQIDLIYKNKVYWKDLNLTSLNNLQPDNDNIFYFYYPHLPPEKLWLEIDNNKITNINIDQGIVNKDLIFNSNILEGNYSSGLYNVIILEPRDIELNHQNIKLPSIKKINFEGFDFYYQEDYYLTDKDDYSLDTGTLFDKSKAYYLYQNDYYYYPIYLINNDDLELWNDNPLDIDLYVNDIKKSKDKPDYSNLLGPQIIENNGKYYYPLYLSKKVFIPEFNNVNLILDVEISNNEIIYNTNYFDILKSLNLSLFEPIILAGKIVNLRQIYQNKILIIQDLPDGLTKLIIPGCNRKIDSFANDYPVNVDQNIISFNQEYKSNQLLVYYYFKDQLQVRKFTLNIGNEIITNTDFETFLDSGYEYYCFIDNFIRIEILEKIENKRKYRILPIDISLETPILLEERSKTNKIHLVKMKFDNGLIKLDKEFDEDLDKEFNKELEEPSEFYLFKIIPVRIKKDVIQLLPLDIKTINYKLTQHQDYLIEKLNLPITIKSSPKLDSKWKIEIESLYSHLILNHDIFLPNLQKINFSIENNKIYIVFPDKPKIDFDYLILQRKSLLKQIKPISNTINLKNTDLIKPLTFDWYLKEELINIPVSINESSDNNTYIILDYLKENLDFGSNYLINPNINIISFGTNDNKLNVKTNNSVNIDNNPYKFNYIYHELPINNNKYTPSEKTKSINKWIDTIKLGLEMKNINLSLKPWLKWSNLVLDNSTIANVAILENSTQKENNSVFLKQEIKNIQKIIPNINLDLLNQIRNIEKEIIDYLKVVIKQNFFWKNPFYYLNQYLNLYYPNWKIEKNCLIKNTDDLNKFDLSDNNYYRNDYLTPDLDFDGNKVTRNKNNINDQVNNLVNYLQNDTGFDFDFGIDIHLLLQKIYKLSIDKSNIIKNIKKGVNYNFNDNYLSIGKLLINKRWEDIKYSYNFNTEFNDNLEIDYIEDNNSGIYNDEFDDIIYYGLDSHNNIKYYPDKEVNNNLDYQIKSNPIFYYQIKSNLPFDPTLSYQLDIKKGDYLLEEKIISFDEISNNRILFKSNSKYLNSNISLNASYQYQIESWEFLGKLFIFDLDIEITPTTNFILNEKLIINKLEYSDGKSHVELISDIDKILYIKLEDQILIKSQEIKNNKLYLEFTKQLNILEKFNKDIFIQLDDSYLVKIDNSEYYIDKNEEIDITDTFNIFIYLNLELDATKTNVYLINLSEDIKNYFYKKEFNINFNVDNLEIDNLIMQSIRQVMVMTQNKLNPKKLNHYFKIDVDDPKKVSDLNYYNKYLYNFEIDFKLNNVDINLISDQVINVNLEKENDTVWIETNNKLDLLKDYTIEINNIIDIDKYTFENNIFSFDLNGELDIRKNSEFKYYLYFDNKWNLVDIDFIKDEIMITLDTEPDFTNVKFKQTNTKKRRINKPELYQKIELELDQKYLLQNNQDIELVYFDKKGKEIGNYIYKFSTTENIDINLDYKLNKEKVLVMYQKGNLVYLTSKNKLSSGIFYSLNNQYILDIDLEYVGRNYQKGLIYKVLSENKFVILISDNNLIIPESNYNLYLLMKRDNLKLSNLDNLTPKYPLEEKNEEIINTTIEKELPKWKENWQFQIFDYISFKLNDQTIDKMQPPIYTIMDQIILTNEKRNQLKEMIKPEFKNDKWGFYLPTFFYFNSDPGLAFPLISVNYNQIILDMKLTDLSNLIENNTKETKIPNNVRVKLYTDTIILDDKERKLFGEFGHEYLIERFRVKPNQYINKINQKLNLNLTGLIKDVFWIFKSYNTGKNYLVKQVKEQDLFVKNFESDYSKYNLFIKQSRTFINIPTTFSEMINLFDKIEDEILVGSELVNILDNDVILKRYDKKFILYLYYYYLSYMDIIDDKKRIMKLNKLRHYFVYNYINKIIEEKVSPVKKLSYRINGKERLSVKDFKYYNCLESMKYESTPEKGIGLYSFSLYPLSKQPSGHINNNILDSSVIDCEMDQEIENQPVIEQTVCREYQILRVISGLGSLVLN